MPQEIPAFPLHLYLQHKTTAADDAESAGEASREPQESDIDSRAPAVMAAARELLAQLIRISNQDKHFRTYRAITGDQVWHQRLLDLDLKGTTASCAVNEQGRLIFSLEKGLESFGRTAALVLVLGSGDRSPLVQQRGWRSRNLLSLDVGPELSVLDVPSASYRTHANLLVAELSHQKSSLRTLLQWFRESEKEVTVPEESLVDSTAWLQQTTEQLRRERLSGESRSQSQRDKFELTFALLADQRQGA